MTFTDVQELAKKTVLWAMEHAMDDDCFFSLQGKGTVFYKVYDNLCSMSMTIGNMFALHMKEKYQIEILID